MQKTMLLLVIAGLFIAGCATTAKMTPQEAAAKATNDWAEALGTGDIEAIMASFSENFEHSEWGDKAGAKQFLQSALDMGYLDGVEIDLTDAEYAVDGDTVTVYPVDLTSSAGAVTIELVFTKEKGGYMITGLDAGM